MWKAAWRGKGPQSPAEALRHTVSKGFWEIWGLRVLRIKWAFVFLGGDFGFLHKKVTKLTRFQLADSINTPQSVHILINLIVLLVGNMFS